MLNFFILISFFDLFLAVFDLSPCRLRPALTGYGAPRRNQFWPFTGVLRGKLLAVTRKMLRRVNCLKPPAGGI
jgi:hypothetical protein